MSRVVHYERVGSTMDVVHELAEQGAAAGTIAIAGEQLAGRGARGRTWHSPPGGLWMSALYRPQVVGGLEVISLRVGLAVAAALDSWASEPLQLKWPNDLFLAGRKVGGILCEARWQGALPGWVAVGVGLNVRNRIPAELHAVATSLAEHRPAITLDDVTLPIAGALDRVDLETDRLSDRELVEFARRDWLRGRQIQEPVQGTVAGLAPDGTLLVRTPNGQDLRVRTGSIELVPASSIG